MTASGESGLDLAFKRLASQRIQLLLDTCDRALDFEACRAEDAERRLESVRETLQTVRAQHEQIFSRYEELKNSVHSSTPVFPLRTFLVKEENVLSAPFHRPHGAGESVVQRMRAQLEGSCKKPPPLTPLGSKRPLTKTSRFGTLSKNFL